MVQDVRNRTLTPALCRGARGLLDWSQANLAEQADVSRSTIKDFEVGAHDLHRATEAQVLRAFEQAGVSIRLIDGLGTALLLQARPEPEGS